MSYERKVNLYSNIIIKNKIHNLYQNIYNTNKHDIDIEEMAKGQVGLKWPPPI